MLDLSRSSGTGIVPCLPCCSTVYQSCSCPTNDRLNEIGGKNFRGENLDKKNPQNLVTFFIKNLFVGESPVANKSNRLDGINQDGMAATAVSCINNVWTFSFASTPRTLQAYVRFAEKKFEGKLVIDGVDSGWVLLTKNFGNEYLTTLTGEISGYQIISHSCCVCRGDVTPSDFYPPYMKETQIRVKPFFVVFSGVPSVCGSDFEINKPVVDFPSILRNEQDLASYHQNYPVTGTKSVRAGPNWDISFKFVFGSKNQTVYCNGLFLYMPFSWFCDRYIQPLDYTDQSKYGNKEAATFTATTVTDPGGNPPGTTHWLNGGTWFFLAGIPANSSNFPGHLPDVFLLPFPDFSYPIKLDLEPFYYEYTAYGFDRSQDDYNLGLKINHTEYDGKIISPRVTITE